MGGAVSVGVDKVLAWFAGDGRSACRPRMPAHEFARALPYWMLLAGAEDDGSIAMELAVFHLWLWGLVEETKADEFFAVQAPADAVERAVDAMRWLLAMESLRRIGVHRFDVSGEGCLLDDDAKITIHLNPAIPHDPNIDPEDLCRQALATDWADLEALR